MVHSPTLLVLLALAATVRLTRIVVADAVFDRPRAWLQGRGDVAAYFWQCPWCVSVWLGIAVAGGTYAWHAYWPVQVLLIGLAGSLAAGVTHLAVERLETE